MRLQRTASPGPRRSTAVRRWFAALALACAALLCAGVVGAKQRTHTVAKGQTLGAIAKRYRVTIAAICSANEIRRTDPIKPGQKLVIPDRSDEDGSKARKKRSKRESKPTRRKRRAPRPATHTVEKGDTLSEIAAKYDVSTVELARENHMTRRDPIRPGQKLRIPGGQPERAKRSHAAAVTGTPDGMQVLPVPGAPAAYYYEPTGRGRLTMRPVIFYLHGRSGNPKADCIRWAKVATSLGWVVCPQGPEPRGGARRGWANNWAAGERIILSALKALRAKYGRRVQLYGNTLVGFSEGAYVAMNVGVRNARTFNRWLILAAHDKYWGGPGLEALQANKRKLRRVYLITGSEDGVEDDTEDVKQKLRRARVPVKVTTPKGMGHEVPLESKRWLYYNALRWLQSG